MMRRLYIPGIIIALAGMSGCSSNNGGTNPPTNPTLSISDVSIIESATASFTVSLSSAASADVVFDFATVDGTAVAGGDYADSSGQDTITAGATSKIIAIPVADDATIEFLESFTVVLSSPENATLGKASGRATINDNDGVSFAANVRPILASRCAIAGCHGSGSVSGGMTMGDASYTTIRNASGNHGKILIPRNGAGSNIYIKISQESPSIGGSRMPLTGGFLTTDQQLLIKNWIDQDAQNN